jgi:Glutaredoxin and related proteins
MEVFSVPDDLREVLHDGKIFMFTKSYCGYCERARKLLDNLGVPYEYIAIDIYPLTPEQAQQLEDLSGITTVPNIFLGTKSIGGYDNLMKLHRSGELEKLLIENGIKVMK